MYIIIQPIIDNNTLNDAYSIDSCVIDGCGFDGCGIDIGRN
ncbi:hypothetical protein [Ruminococcus flavefaciens]|nr:hypothetical protein [Ruminococcus flavefaciens]